MPIKIKDAIDHFQIEQVTRNTFEVTYKSPTNGMEWKQLIDDKKLINQAKEGINLRKLKFICKL